MSGSGQSARSDDEVPPLGPDEELPKIATDWRSFRARLITQESQGKTSTSSGTKESSRFWTHRVSHVESGCLLVARREGFADCRGSYFDGTVIFILHYSEKDGTIGVVLNRPIASSLAGVPTDTSSVVGETFGIAKAELFHSTPLYNGGPLGTDSLLLLHDKPGLPSSKQVISGVYSGGLMGAIVSVREGSLEASRCSFFAGYSGWAPGQLEDEIAQGVWTLAASSPELVIEYNGEDSEMPMWDMLTGELGDGPSTLD